MKVRRLWPFLPAEVFLLIFAAGGRVGAVVSAPVRTRAYYALERNWAAHWPFAPGKDLPHALRPTLQPFAPTWVQVEPRIRMLLDPNDLVPLTILQTGV